MGSRRDCTWILGLTGFRVVTANSDHEASDGRLTIRIERRGLRRYPCSGCGRHVSRVRSVGDRTWDDVPWASHPVTLIYAQRRVRCRHCGIRTEAIAFVDPKARVMRRLRQQIGVDCQSMPTSHAAVRHGVSCGKSPSSRARVPTRLGAPAPSTTSPISGCGRDPPRQSAEVLHGAVGRRARRGDRIGKVPDHGQLGGLADDLPGCPAARGGRGRLHRHASALRERRGAPAAGGRDRVRSSRNT